MTWWCCKADFGKHEPTCKNYDAWVAKWHKKYKEAIMAHCADCTAEFAEDTLQAGMGEYDYCEDPEEAALEEMSYWID